MISIKTVEDKKGLKAFVKMPFALYRNEPLWVPPLIQDELALFNTKRNPIYKDAEARLFIAYKNGKPAGRVAGILSHGANRKNQSRNLRFGWFETIEDLEVARSLIGSLERWARQIGMENITGPQGFCDLDRQGMLIKGFEELPTVNEIYNPPYYPVFMEELGFQKDADYISYQWITADHKEFRDNLANMVDSLRVANENLKLHRPTSRKVILQRCSDFQDVLNDSFHDIYGTVPLSYDQLYYYMKKYYPVLVPDLIRYVTNEKDEIIGFALLLPSLADAFQKARGRLFPWGWLHILRALRVKNIVDTGLIGVKKQYQRGGVSMLMALDFLQHFFEAGYAVMESNPALEENRAIRALVEMGVFRIHKNRRVYIKHLK